MVAPQYLQRRAPKGEPFSIIVINKSKIVSARYAFCTFKLMNWQKMSEKQKTKNLRPIWNWWETFILRVLTVQRTVGDGVTSEHELNGKFYAIMIPTVDSFFWIAGNFEKVFKKKVALGKLGTDGTVIHGMRQVKYQHRLVNFKLANLVAQLLSKIYLSSLYLKAYWTCWVRF